MKIQEQAQWKRVYLTGNSMGGYGTFNLATIRPRWFAAAMPLCGSAELIFFPSLPHNIWSAVYDNDENYDWLFSFTAEWENEYSPGEVCK